MSTLVRGGGADTGRRRPASVARARRRRRGGGYFVFLLPGILASTVVVIIPLLMTVGISFTRWPGIGDPEWIGLDNYTRLLEDELFWKSFRNIAAIIVAMAVVPTLIGLVLAAVLFDYVGKVFGPRTANVFRSGFYLPQVIPVAVTGIVWGWILHPDYGALNRILGGLGVNWLGDERYALYSVMGVLVWVQIGYPLVMFMAGLQRVDPQLYEAADLDGASWWQRFRHITVHMLRPEFYVVLVTTTIAALKVFGPIFVLTNGGPANATLVPSYFAWRNFFERANVGYGSAISVVLTVIILALAFVFLKLQTKGEDAR